MIKKLLIALFILLTISSGAYAAAPTNDAKLQYNEGVSLYKVGEYDRSMVAFRKAIELDPNYIDAYYNLGTILEYLQQYDSALTIFKQIIVRKPDDYESVYKAASLSVRLGQADKAKSYLSIIPSSSDIAPQAQQLAHQLQTDMQTIKTQEKAKEDALTKMPQSNNIYNNIPSPTGMTTDSNGNLYVAGFSDNTIYKITPDGTKIIFLKDVRVNGPIGMVSDSSGNIYIANYNNNNVLKISSNGAVSILINNVMKPYGLHLENGLLFVSCQGDNSILRYKL